MLYPSVCVRQIADDHKTFPLVNSWRFWTRTPVLVIIIYVRGVVIVLWGNILNYRSLTSKGNDRGTKLDCHFLWIPCAPRLGREQGLLSNASRKPFPNAFLTVAAVGKNEHVMVHNLTAGTVHGRKGMSVFDLVLGNNGVTLCTPHARHLPTFVTLMEELIHLPFFRPMPIFHLR